MTFDANEAFYETNRKSTALAYLFWLFLGPFGAHRFYCGRKTGVLMPALLVAGMLLGVSFSETAAGSLFVFPAVVGFWLLVDAFLVHGWVRDHNLELSEHHRR